MTGIYFDQTYAPVVQKKMMMFAIAANEDLVIHHIDITAAYLSSDLNEEVYMVEPKGYEEVFDILNENSVDLPSKEEIT
ncbi:hypothetical protein JTB14_002141 [Gonioctena quinquepunctata]|nr:hypothetical protein JTB14_002141 [Gonioctena quinquepunctata]